MKNQKFLSVLPCLLACLAFSSQAFGQAQIHTLYATDIPLQPNWDFEDRAEGPHGDIDCNNSTYAVAVANTASWLAARSFDNFQLPPNHRISGVWMDALVRYNTGETGSAGLRVSLGTGNPLFYQVVCFNSGSLANCRWRWNDVGRPHGWDITGLMDWNSNPNLINQLDLLVRRNTHDPTCDSSTRLRCKAFRIVVETIPDCNGDGVKDNGQAGYSDLNGNGVWDICDTDFKDCDGNLLWDDYEFGYVDCGPQPGGNNCWDKCDIMMNPMLDLDGNGGLDICQPGYRDCDGNNKWDQYESGYVDCGPGASGNNRWDKCDIALNPNLDLDMDGGLDSCQPGYCDCNNNGRWDIYDPNYVDCGPNGGNDKWDMCDIMNAPYLDLDENGVIDDCEEAGTPYCGPAVQNSTMNSAHLVALGSPSITQDNLTLWCGNLPEGENGYFLVSQGTLEVPMAGGSMGTLCIFGPNFGRYNQPRFIFTVDGDIGSGDVGTVTLPVDPNVIPQGMGPVPALAGATWNFQCWYRDHIGNMSTSNHSNAVSVTFLP